MREYTYLTPMRPSSPGAIPEIGLLKVGEFKKCGPVEFMANGYKHRRKAFGIVSYLRKLSLRELFHYSLVEANEILETPFWRSYKVKSRKGIEAMVTNKKINEALPRIDTLRREYRTYGSTGWTSHHTTFAGAYISMDDDGMVSIRVYGVGDAYEVCDYRGETISITEVVHDWIAGEIDRRMAVQRIREIVEVEA